MAETTTSIAPIILAGVGIFTAVTTLIVGAVWFGKLSSRVERLEKDVKDLLSANTRTNELLNRHLGFHQGKGDP